MDLPHSVPSVLCVHTLASKDANGRWYILKKDCEDKTDTQTHSTSQTLMFVFLMRTTSLISSIPIGMIQTLWLFIVRVVIHKKVGADSVELFSFCLCVSHWFLRHQTDLTDIENRPFWGWRIPWLARVCTISLKIQLKKSYQTSKQKTSEDTTNLFSGRRDVHLFSSKAPSHKCGRKRHS